MAARKKRTRRPRESIRLMQTAGVIASATWALDSTIPNLLQGNWQGAIDGLREDMMQLPADGLTKATPAIAGFVASWVAGKLAPQSLKLKFDKYNLRL